MPFLTGLTYQNIIDREPAVSAYIPDYTTTIQSRIDEAKAVIDNRLRAMGYDLDKLGIKNYFSENDNDAGTDSVELTLTSAGVNNLLLILKINGVTSLDAVTVEDSYNATVLSETSAPVYPRPSGFILPYVDTTSMTLTVEKDDTTFAAGSILAYLTDPALYMVHLYKSLELIFEGMRAEPGDIFEQKSIRYNDLYEAEFNGLVTYYDRNGDGTTNEEDGQKPIKQGRLMR